MIQSRAFGVLGSVLAAASLMVGSNQAPQSQTWLEMESKATIRREPVVIFDVSGGTLLGPVAEHLAVYDDGFASYSQSSPLDNPSVETRMLSPTAIQQLVLDLNAAGAHTLGDQTTTVTDVPLTTVTVFRGGADARAHTFSYWLGSNAYSATQGVLADLIETEFSQTGG